MYGKTVGPPTVRSSVPATASIWSRMISASSRWRGMRQNSRFSGSIATFAATSPLAIWYASDVIISRCIAFRLQPRSTNSSASQSSSSGCDGGSPILPKLLGVRTMPSPK